MGKFLSFCLSLSLIVSRLLGECHEKIEEMIQILNVSRFEIRSSEHLFVNKFLKEKDLIREKHVHCS